MKKAIEEIAQRFKMYERFSRYGESTEEEYFEFYPDELEEFAELVAAREREACAKVCEATLEQYRGTPHGQAAEMIGDKCAAAIRARGEQKR